MKYIYLSREGYEKLREEYEYLTTVKRKEVAEQLRKARLLGDLRENAEYESAKQAQALLEKRISELEEKLSRVKIIADESIASDKVYLGAKVVLKDLDTNEQIEYTLVDPEEANVTEGKISAASPVGKALIGHRVSDKVTIEVPAGILRYEILSISR